MMKKTMADSDCGLPCVRSAVWLCKGKLRRDTCDDV